MTSSERQEIRMLIVQVLLANDFSGKEPVAADVCATFNLLAREHNPALVDNDVAQRTLAGIAGKYGKINQIVEMACCEYRPDTIGRVAKNIFRLGVFEIVFGEELAVPGQVALSETTELTAMFLNDAMRNIADEVLGHVYVMQVTMDIFQKSRYGKHVENYLKDDM